MGDTQVMTVKMVREMYRVVRLHKLLFGTCFA